MTPYVMHDILNSSMFWRIWRREPLYLFFGERGSDGLGSALANQLDSSQSCDG